MCDVYDSSDINVLRERESERVQCEWRMKREIHAKSRKEMILEKKHAAHEDEEKEEDEKKPTNNHVHVNQIKRN